MDYLDDSQRSADEQSAPVFIYLFESVKTTVVPANRMSLYLDVYGDPLHREDSVVFPGRPDLKGQRGIIDSFYLKRDGLYRAKVFLVGQASRAMGVLVRELQKAVPEGPEPVYDPFLHVAAEIEAALSTQQELGATVQAVCMHLELALAEVADAMRVWPPELESGEGALSDRAAALQEAAAATARACAACEKKSVKALFEALGVAAKSTLWALGCFALQHSDSYGPDQLLAHRRLHALGKIQEIMMCPDRSLDCGRMAAHHRATALAALHAVRRPLPPLRRMFMEGLREAQLLEELDVAPALAAGRVGLHRPQKSSPHARAERRGGFLLYVPEVPPALYGSPVPLARLSILCSAEAPWRACASLALQLSHSVPTWFAASYHPRAHPILRVRCHRHGTARRRCRWWWRFTERVRTGRAFYGICAVRLVLAALLSSRPRRLGALGLPHLPRGLCLPRGPPVPMQTPRTSLASFGRSARDGQSMSGGSSSSAIPTVLTLQCAWSSEGVWFTRFARSPRSRSQLNLPSIWRRSHSGSTSCTAPGTPSSLCSDSSTPSTGVFTVTSTRCARPDSIWICGLSREWATRSRRPMRRTGC